jgi:hypothetical protein
MYYGLFFCYFFLLLFFFFKLSFTSKIQNLCILFFQHLKYLVKFDSFLFSCSFSEEVLQKFHNILKNRNILTEITMPRTTDFYFYFNIANIYHWWNDRCICLFFELLKSNCVILSINDRWQHHVISAIRGVLDRYENNIFFFNRELVWSCSIFFRRSFEFTHFLCSLYIAWLYFSYLNFPRLFTLVNLL